jgi:hypothetical protein
LSGKRWRIEVQGLTSSTRLPRLSVVWKAELRRTTRSNFVCGSPAHRPETRRPGAVISGNLRQLDGRRIKHRYAVLVRVLVTSVFVVLVGCSSRADTSRRDVTADVWYGSTVTQLAGIDRSAEDLFRRGRADEAAALIQQGQPLMNRLLSVPRPTLAATEAASDLDELYGRMLLANRHYGWARLLFQKNLSRWTNWRPASPETERRFREASDEIAECDRHL